MNDFVAARWRDVDSAIDLTLSISLSVSVEEQARISAISTHIDIEAATEPGLSREAKVGSGREVSIKT